MNNFIPDIDEEINPHTITLDINTNKNALRNAFTENYYAFVCLYALKLFPNVWSIFNMQFLKKKIELELYLYKYHAI